MWKGSQVESILFLLFHFYFVLDTIVYVINLDFEEDRITWLRQISLNPINYVQIPLPINTR